MKLKTFFFAFELFEKKKLKNIYFGIFEDKMKRNIFLNL